MTTTETSAKLMTAEELLRLGDDARGELIRGVFCEMSPPGTEHTEISASLTGELYAFTKPRRLGRLSVGDLGVRLERDPDTVRAPDLAYTSAERASRWMRIPGYAEVVPDLVAEVRSPNDTRREVREKALMWLSHGVRLVWVVHPDTRTIDVYREGVAPATLAEPPRWMAATCSPASPAPSAPSSRRRGWCRIAIGSERR